MEAREKIHKAAEEWPVGVALNLIQSFIREALIEALFESLYWRDSKPHARIVLCGIV